MSWCGARARTCSLVEHGQAPLGFLAVLLGVFVPLELPTRASCCCCSCSCWLLSPRVGFAQIRAFHSSPPAPHSSHLIVPHPLWACAECLRVVIRRLWLSAPVIETPLWGLVVVCFRGPLAPQKNTPSGVFRCRDAARAHCPCDITAHATSQPGKRRFGDCVLECF